MINKNLCTFLLADTQDVFFTKHLLRLDFEQYLYWYLKGEEQYKAVFFIDSNANEVKVFFEDDHSAEIYHKEVPESFWAGRPELRTGTIHERSRLELSQRNNKLSQRINKESIKTTWTSLIGNKNEKYAFVMSYRSYRSLCMMVDGFEKDINTIGKDIGKDSHKFYFIESLDFKDFPIDGISTLKWDPFAKEQIESMVQRGCMNMTSPFEKEDKNLICEYLLSYFQITYTERERLLGEQIHKKSQLFDRILTNENRMNELKKLACSKND